jgi:hypothetical protein
LNAMPGEHRTWFSMGQYMEVSISGIYSNLDGGRRRKIPSKIEWAVHPKKNHVIKVGAIPQTLKTMCSQKQIVSFRSSAHQSPRRETALPADWRTGGCRPWRP